MMRHLRRGTLGPPLAVLGASAIVVTALCLLPSDMERYWLAFTGDWSIAHGRILETLQGSWYPDRRWVNEEWLVGLATAWTRAHGLYVLLELLFAASLAAGVAFVAYEGVRTRTHPLIACAQTGIAALAAIFFAQDRAQTLVWALFPALIIVWRARPWAAVPILALWANVHGSFPVGVLWMALHLDRRRAAPFALATLATLLNPLGWHLWLFTLTLAHNGRLGPYVSEWMPALSTFTGAFVVLLALAPLWLRLAAGARVRRPVRWGELAFLAASAIGTIVAVRYSMLLFLTTATILGHAMRTAARPMRGITRAAALFFVAMVFVLGGRALLGARVNADPLFGGFTSGVDFGACAPFVRGQRVFTDAFQIGSLVDLAGGSSNVDGRIDAFPLAAIQASALVLRHPHAAEGAVDSSGATALAIAGRFWPSPRRWRLVARCSGVRIYSRR
jgi:hypothetical protein